MLILTKCADDASITLELHNVNKSGEYVLDDHGTPPVQELVLPRSWKNTEQVRDDLCVASTPAHLPDIWWGGYRELLVEFMEILNLQLSLLMYPWKNMSELKFGFDDDERGFLPSNTRFSHDGLSLHLGEHPDDEVIDDISYLILELLDESRFRFLRWVLKPPLNKYWRRDDQRDGDCSLTLPWEQNPSYVAKRVRREVNGTLRA